MRENTNNFFYSIFVNSTVYMCLYVPIIIEYFMRGVFLVVECVFLFLGFNCHKVTF